MGVNFKSTLALTALALTLGSTTAGAIEQELSRPKTYIEAHKVSESFTSTKSMSYAQVLSDHPGSATALTSRQKSEIRSILAKGARNKSFICTGASLAGQRESMYRVVLLRAQLVCEYAKFLNPSIRTTVQAKITAARKFNGRVVVVSR